MQNVVCSWIKACETHHVTLAGCLGLVNALSVYIVSGWSMFLLFGHCMWLIGD
jgi:hypothetical protein